ncbi:hypothetical protein LP417_33915 (plasmid) [Polaromonas sp. P1-6]|nr:hypothetical protein LP417_33915 [Polaromonas sp. P1-6]
MTKNIKAILGLALVSTVALTGCSTYLAKNEVNEVGKSTTSKISAVTTQATSRVFASRENGQDVAAPWIAGKSVPLAKEVSVPAPLRRNVKTTILSQACVTATTLNVIGACITEATGVSVRVKPEARLPYSMFAPRTGAAGTNGAAAVPLPD